jgi:hypothetical protein
MMLSLVDQLLMAYPLLRCELPIDLGAHARFDGIESRPDLRPEGVGLGPMARDDGAHGIPLRGAQVQLTAEVRNERVGTAPTGTPALVAFRGCATAPPGETAGEEHGGKQADGSEFRSIQHGVSSP